jgi:Uncharacterized conserved protein
MQFKPVTIKDKEAITAYTRSGDFLNCDFAFSNMCSWRFLYDSEFAIDEGFLYIRFFIKHHRVYMFPIGTGDLKQAFRKIEKDAKGYDSLLRIFGVTPPGKDKMETLFPGEFTFTANRNYFDYIYLREDLCTLKGKKYQAKRNHINKFKKSYTYTYLPITPNLIPECLKLEQQWIQSNHNEKDTDALEFENRSMVFALNNFDALDLTGGAIFVENEMVAFTYGSPINQYTFDIHVEKADIRFEGVFSVINQEFAVRLPEHYLYINREEDLGLPGLRQSKLSYQPAILLEKNMAVKIN